MWGKIEANKIKQLYNNPINLVDAKGTVYPKSYFQDNAKLEPFSVYPVINTNSPPVKAFLYDGGDESFLWKSANKNIERTYTATAKPLDDKNEVWTQSEIDDGQAPSGKKANDPKLDADGKQIVTYGLKTLLTAEVKSRQSTLLAITDKWIVRKAEKGTAIPSTVTTWRDGIRSAATTMQTKITDASDFDAISALFDATYNSSGVMTAPAPLYNIPSKPDGMPE